MFEGNIKIRDKEIPRVLLGTSPFIGAAQFGHRARLYQLDFYKHPENIFKIIRSSYEHGIKGIQIIPYEPVIEAVKLAISDGCELNIVGTVRPGHENEDITLLSKLKSSAMLLHAEITDKMDWNFLIDTLNAINEKKTLSGLATHQPFKTMKNLLTSPILDLFEIFMLPVNKLGYLMDSMDYGPSERVQLENLVKKLNKKVIAKKILAAGILKPEEAFNYLKTLDYVDMITLGIASETEVRQTFELLSKK
jgi:hypothetical protein